MKEKNLKANYDVFLSHSAKDREFVWRLATDLIKAGLTVWLDQWNIRPGDSFAEAIDKAIAESRFLLIVMSPDYFQSQWTQQEWYYALANEIDRGGIRLIPLLYRDCDIPLMLRTKQWVDFRDEAQYQISLHRLARDLHSLASSETQSIEFTETPRPGERVEELDPTTLSELKNVLRDAVEAFRAKPEIAPRPATAAEALDVEEDVCFIIMPFSVESLNIVYEDFVRPTLVDRCSLRPERGDDVFGSNVIMDDIAKSIRRARLIIADLTGRNANVFYEVGIAHALNKQVLLMTQSIEDVPF
jgi:TIR domain